jgi:hypothetical protein
MNYSDIYLQNTEFILERTVVYFLIWQKLNTCNDYNRLNLKNTKLTPKKHHFIQRLYGFKNFLWA